MDLCANILYEKFVRILDAFDTFLYFLQLNSYLNILKYPKFS